VNFAIDRMLHHRPNRFRKERNVGRPRCRVAFCCCYGVRVADFFGISLGNKHPARFGLGMIFLAYFSARGFKQLFDKHDGCSLNFRGSLQAHLAGQYFQSVLRLKLSARNCAALIFRLAAVFLPDESVAVRKCGRGSPALSQRAEKFQFIEQLRREPAKEKFLIIAAPHLHPGRPS